MKFIIQYLSSYVDSNITTAICGLNRHFVCMELYKLYEDINAKIVVSMAWIKFKYISSVNILAVSYTHLDVYKRQLYYNCPGRL